MPHTLGLSHLVALALCVPPLTGRAEEPCAPVTAPDAALFDALREGDPRAASSAWEALVDVSCPGAADAGEVGSWTAAAAVRDAWGWVPDRSGRGGSWVPTLSVVASATPAWRASTRLDAGRTVAVGVGWSVGLGLRFAPRRRVPDFAWTAELSRSEARRVVDDAGATVAPADTATVHWRIDALARRVGARIDHLLAAARARHATPPAADLRARVLDVVARQEELALLGAWLGGGTHR